MSALAVRPVGNCGCSWPDNKTAPSQLPCREHLIALQSAGRRSCTKMLNMSQNDAAARAPRCAEWQALDLSGDCLLMTLFDLNRTITGHANGLQDGATWRTL